MVFDESLEGGRDPGARAGARFVAEKRQRQRHRVWHCRCYQPEGGRIAAQESCREEGSWLVARVKKEGRRVGEIDEAAGNVISIEKYRYI